MINNILNKAKNIIFNNKNNGLTANNVQEAINQVSESPKDGIHFGFSCYQGTTVAGIFVPLANYIINNYEINPADKIYFSGVSEYTVDSIVVKNNGIFVGHKFSTTSEALNSIKAVSNVNGTIRLTFRKK